MYYGERFNSITHTVGAALAAIGGTLLIVFLYGASDEFHQSFVPTRTARVSDVFIDTAGGAFGLLVLWFFNHCRNRRRQIQK